MRSTYPTDIIRPGEPLARECSEWILSDTEEARHRYTLNGLGDRLNNVRHSEISHIWRLRRRTARRLQPPICEAEFVEKVRAENVSFMKKKVLSGNLRSTGKNYQILRVPHVVVGEIIPGCANRKAIGAAEGVVE